MADLTGVYYEVGQMVKYRMPSWVAEPHNLRRKDARMAKAWHAYKRTGSIVHVGNEVEQGKVYPAMIVAVWGTSAESAVNLKVFLDGNDELWVTSVSRGTNDGHFTL